MSMIGDRIFSPSITQSSVFNNLYRSESFTDSIIGSLLNFASTSCLFALPLQPIAFLSSLGLKMKNLSVLLLRIWVTNCCFKIPVDCEISTSEFPLEPKEIPSRHTITSCSSFTSSLIAEIRISISSR